MIKKEIVQSRALKAASFLVAVALSVFGLGSAAAIFIEIIPIVENLHYTKAQIYAIIVGIALVLMWLVVLLADSAEHIIKAGFKRADKLIIEGENNE